MKIYLKKGTMNTTSNIGCNILGVPLGITCLSCPTNYCLTFYLKKKKKKNYCLTLKLFFFSERNLTLNLHLINLNKNILYERIVT